MSRLKYSMDAQAAQGAMARVRRVVERASALASGAKLVVERAGHRPPVSFVSRSLQVCLTAA